MANVQIYNGKHFFPGTETHVHHPGQPVLESECLEANNGWTQMLSKGTSALKGDQKRHCCPSAECTSAPPSAKRQARDTAHTASLGTATLRFLGFSFHVAQAKHCPLCPPPTTFTESSSWQCTIQLIKYLLLHDIHILDLPSSVYTQITYLNWRHISDGLLLYPNRWLITVIICEFC